MRSAVVFGPDDHFTNELVRLLRMSPVVFLLPGEGNTFLQPIWVEDLVTGLILAMEEPNWPTRHIRWAGRNILLFAKLPKWWQKRPKSGGSFSRSRRPICAFWRSGLRTRSGRFPHGDLSGRITWRLTGPGDLDTLPRLFGLMPERLSKRLDYLRPEDYVSPTGQNLPTAG